MKYCVKCGEKLGNKTSTCPTCGYTPKDKKTNKKQANQTPMLYCTKCGGRISSKTFLCPSCGCLSIGKKTLKNPNDKISLGLCLISFLIPLFGLIYWAVKHKEMPEKAQAAGLMSVISLTVCFAMMNGIYIRI